MLYIGIHDDVLDKVASLIAVEWEDLAAHLGFVKADIDAIKDGNKLEAQRIYKMLCQWRYRQHYKTDRVKYLAEGLRKCGLQNIADIVLDLVGNNRSGSAPPSPTGMCVHKGQNNDNNVNHAGYHKS